MSWPLIDRHCLSVASEPGACAERSALTNSLSSFAQKLRQLPTSLAPGYAIAQTGFALCSSKRAGICGNAIQVSNNASPCLPIAEDEIMSKLIFGAAIAAVSIASPALAQYASRSDPQISVHHRQHLRLSSHPSYSPALASPPRDPRTWVGDPAGRPYVYVPGMAEGQ